MRSISLVLLCRHNYDFPLIAVTNRRNMDSHKR